MIDLNAKFAGVTRVHVQIRRHERSVHGDLNLGPVSISQRRCGDRNTAAAAATGCLGDLCLLFIHPPARGSEVSPAARNTLDSARIPTASKLLICGLFQKGRVLAQDGVLNLTKTRVAARRVTWRKGHADCFRTPPGRLEARGSADCGGGDNARPKRPAGSPRNPARAADA